MHCCKILLVSAYLHLPDGSQAVPNCISSTAMNYGITWPPKMCGVLFCLTLALHGQGMHHREALSKWRWVEETGKRRIFLLKALKVLGDFLNTFISTLGEKKDQQQWSWSAFGPGCDRALKDFMGRCHMIHWVIGFRPVLIAGRPEPKNLEGFLRVLFSAVQQNGIWSASASRHSRRPSQFLGALIQTTWRPASGYGPFTKKKKKKEI